MSTGGKWFDPSIALALTDELSGPSGEICSSAKITSPFVIEGTLPQRPKEEQTKRWNGNPWLDSKARSDVPLSDDLPRQLGRYERLALIGEGGMAAIFLARLKGPAGFKRPVAIKVVHRHLRTDERLMQMFVEEATITSRLSHPNIVQLFELDEVDGVYFVAMELLVGEQLRRVSQRLSQGRQRLDPRLACHIINEAASGLHCAHELTDYDGRPLRLVHRDVSPQNLFITYSGTVKLLDFGIAKALSSSHATRPGVIKGKCAYMSPEQVAGKGLDRRSDLFSLGSNLWELLTGQSAFKTDSRVRTLEAVHEAKLPNLSQVRPGLPSELDEILAKTLARRPRDRYPDVESFQRDLESVLGELGGPLSKRELGETMLEAFEVEFHQKSIYLSEVMQRDENEIKVADDPLRTARHDPRKAIELAKIFEAQTAVENTPLPRVPASRALPQAALDEDVSSSWTPTGSASRPRIRLRKRCIALVGLALLCLGVGAAVWLASEPANADASPAMATGTTGIDALESGPVHSESAVEERSRSNTGVAEPERNPIMVEQEPVAELDSSDELLLRIIPEPRHARVFLDGERNRLPWRIPVERSDEPISVRVSAEGYIDLYFQVVPDRSRTRWARLRPVPSESQIDASELESASQVEPPLLSLVARTASTQ